VGLVLGIFSVRQGARTMLQTHRFPKDGYKEATECARCPNPLLPLTTKITIPELCAGVTRSTRPSPDETTLP
jgi:hypothetical protein